jgi:GAF domain-containing protein
MKHPSLLAGLVFDSEDHRMTPTHAIKKGTRYRYYVSRPLINESRANAPDALRIPASDIERLVVTRIGQFFSEPARLSDALAAHIRTAAQQRQLLQRAAELAASWSTLTAAQLRTMLTAMVQRIVVGLDRVDIQLVPSRIAAALRDRSPSPSAEGCAESDERPIVLSVPAQLRRVGLGIRMLIAGADSPGRAEKADPKLIKLIARAHLLSNRLAESGSEYLADVAQAEGLTSSYFTRVLRLTYLAPDITRAILDGRHPRDLTAQNLLAHSRLPLSWPERRRVLGVA